jgi:hypothetical protein
MHCSETIGRTIMSLEAMLQQSSAQNSVNNPNAQVTLENATTHLEFQIQMLRGLQLRSQANRDRLSNEVTLVSNHYEGREIIF